MAEDIDNEIATCKRHLQVDSPHATESSAWNIGLLEMLALVQQWL